MKIRLKATAPWGTEVRLPGGLVLKKGAWQEVESVVPFERLGAYLEVKDESNIIDVEFETVKPTEETTTNEAKEASIDLSTLKKPELVDLATKSLGMTKSAANKLKKSELMEKLS